MRLVLASSCILMLFIPAEAQDGNRLTYLDENTPYYVARTFPKLTTPMWIGEEGVEAVVVLAIDDMRDPDKYEGFLRPILERLKHIDGRAALSIMTNQVNPAHPRLQEWLREGLSLEVHTIDHPCPCLAKGSLKNATLTYENCVDLMNQVPGNRPVAFRMPCCDSLNTVSPRFFSEVFNRSSAKGHHLSIDSSVFNILSANDPALPRELVVGSDGSDRFRRYLPPDRSFVNTIENYPYPYVIGRLCWELPCAVPSDWEAQHIQKPNNPQTVKDWKTVLDATVIKQGVMCIVFHPHNWIKNSQVVEFIDHAVSKHGNKVKFLNFREVQERLDRNLLGGQPLRRADGKDNGVRLLDLDNDGYLDIVTGNEQLQQTRRWDPKRNRWETSPFPTPLALNGVETGCRFGVVLPDGHASLVVRNQNVDGGWHFDGTKWIEFPSLLRGVDAGLRTTNNGHDSGLRFRDLDRDGCCELIAGGPARGKVYRWSKERLGWSTAPFSLPSGVTLTDEQGRDHGVRFVDVNEDGFDDLLVSNESQSALHLFKSMKEGWARESCVAPRNKPGEAPPITWQGSDRGAWFHSRSLWVHNEDTAHLKDHVDRRSFNELLQNVEPTAKSPDATLRSISTRPGFVVELMAAEPLVQDPIAFAFGPDGKLWVVEMGDYPKGVDGKGKPGGRVKYLEDTKGDGTYDKATLFLDNLPFPTGVLPWKKGVLVTCAPDIFYAEDTDGDGKADRREVLYRGFVEGNQQHRVNGLVRGLDNWIYGANGDSGGKIRSLKTGQVVDISGRDFRIRPDTGEIEAQTGQSQFGRCFDDWGNAFGCNNSNPAYHYVLADHYLRRNPHFTPTLPRRDVTVPPGAAPVLPISRTLPRFNDPHTANHFTSACGLTIYRDELFGPAFAGNLFVSEPVHNLVHREVMSPQGFSFTARRAVDEQRSEFLASTDNWFRPTSLATGPDGALWVADMYRAVIEHPQWIPPDWQKRLDLRAGHDLGRIYRVYPVGARPRPIPRLDRLSNQELAQGLDSPSAWHREMCQQLLLERHAVAVAAQLEQLAKEAKRPQARLHALCTLDGLRILSPTLLKALLNDAHPGVRRHAVRLCEGRLEEDPGLRQTIMTLIEDADPQVQLQLASSLGSWKSPEAARALTRLAQRGAGQPYLTAAVISSLDQHNFDTVLLQLLQTQPGNSDLSPYLRLVPALASEQTWDRVIVAITPSKNKTTVSSFEQLADLLDAIGTNPSPSLRSAAPIFAAARSAFAQPEGTLAEQIAASRVLGRDTGRLQEDTKLLAGHLHPSVPVELQAAIARALANLGASETILSRWKSLSPAIRQAAMEALLQRREGPHVVLTAIRSRLLAASELTPAQRSQILTIKDEAIHRLALTVLGATVASDRQKLIEQYRSVTAMTGDPARGAQLFAKHCTTCHRLNQVGHDVGPDLASLGDKSPEALLIAVLDPNRAVETRYLQYVVVTQSGRTVMGILRQETSTTITLVGPDGKTETLLRRELDEFASSGKSAMPEGLENELKPQDLADLFAHLRGTGTVAKRKVFPNNQPALIHADPDGVLTLPATKAEIYGPSLVLEMQYSNLGYWQSADDHAAWEVEVPQAGKYAVQMEWACPPNAAGNIAKVQVGVNPIHWPVASTGSWDVYRRAKIGDLNLTAGRQRVTVRAEGKPAECLFDLKTIQLVPLTK